FIIFLALLIAINVFSQLPQKMSYQAVIRNSNNNLVINSEIGVKISILQSSINGQVVYSETQTPITNSNGLITIEIGQNGDFSSVDWASGPYFIKTEVDPTGGINYTIIGTSQLLSVPYALYAKVAEEIAGGITETDPIFGSSVASNITTTDTIYWNNKLDSYTETDPNFNSSLANSITETDTIYWNNKLDSYTETDPVFSSSLANNITETDTANWNNKLDSYIETDPLFISSLANNITEIDTANWNNKLDIEMDGDIMNEIQTISRVGLNVNLSNGGGSYKDSIHTYFAGEGIEIANDTIKLSDKHYVGELYGGGIVFWLTPDGEHGLIASLVDLDNGDGVQWGLYGITVGCISMTDGKTNTANIVAAGAGSNTAAVLCDVYTGGGFSDWYLPSSRELSLLASQDILIDYLLDNDGDDTTIGFSQEYIASTYGGYWSSTECDDNNLAWGYTFRGVYFLNKLSSLRVRAIRAF
ncbi:hypothetical protein ACFLTE_11860, partial [Bacteroidota bacterium]